MKKIILLCLAMTFLMSTSVYAASVINKDGYYKNIRLAGKVKIVESFGDIKVQVVTAFPDIKVKSVTSLPDDIGEWQFVDSFPDFTIQFVEAFPDIKVQFVEAFPGLP